MAADSSPPDPTTVSVTTAGQVAAALERLYPPAWAQDWDAVGLVCGDPDDVVERVLLAVDPVAAVADEAIAVGAQMVITHHPLLLRGVHSVAATTAKGELVHRLVRAGIALHVSHTNADTAVPGVSDALARTLGLTDLEPLDAADGSGSGEPSGRGIGRVGRLPAPTSLERFATAVAQALPHTAQGVRVAGDPDAVVERVAVCGGSGDSLFDVVRASGADVFVTADLRHHPASEAREHSRGGAPFLVDVSHWASEWPWLHGCADRLAAELPSGTTVDLVVSTTCTDPWTFRVPSSGGLLR